MKEERKLALLALLKQPVVRYGKEIPTDEEICFLLKRLATREYDPIALELDEIPLSEEALHHLGAAFNACSKLIFVSLSFCELDDKKFMIFSKFLENLPLMGIDLAYNNIGQRAINVLCRMIERKHLLHLNLDGNKKVGYSCAHSFQEVLAKNTNLLLLDILDTTITTYPPERLSEAARSGELDVMANLEKGIRDAIAHNQQQFQEKIKDPKGLDTIVIPESLECFLRARTALEISLEDTPLLFIAQRKRELQQSSIAYTSGFTPLSVGRKAREADERKEPETDTAKNVPTETRIHPL